MQTPFHAFVKARELEHRGVMMAPNITTELVEAMAGFALSNRIFADMGFEDDTAMANAHYILKDLGIEIKLV